MAFFRTIGKGVGMVTGAVVGGGVKLAGKALKSDLVEGVGSGITKGSPKALDTAGRLLDGIVKGTFGGSKNQETKQTEINDLKGSAGTALEGLETSVTYTVKSAGFTYDGGKTNHTRSSTQKGNKMGNFAAVGVMSVGLVDFIDGVNSVTDKEGNTRNGEQAGNSHSKSQVPFVEKTIELPIGEVTGTFPVFDVGYQVSLPSNLYLQPDSVHFSYANVDLLDALQSNPDLIHELGLDHQDIAQLKLGNNPGGYTWHHHEEPGVLQLVDEDFHQHTGHTGGRELWGGGFENR
ncbi:DNase/tRNase domain of colicin-like bacteriocin [Mesobacillus persicus]|uniref:DNase/tRNase domain of colicin-like bacteriocin n=1 Tax=Mesobacillus persicus TaxID=930146 RepID=A0A1H8I1H6_9BACI|nr:HNH endonuclease [Mesobacillus persicus]SEN62121.1 DNase/tRNase domain of colicin-like bacteriocin [Mesobacillus persicus]